MDKSNVIKEILGSIFFVKGFTYKTEKNIWIFEREYENKVSEMINQQVYVQKSNHGKALYFRMQTNAYGQIPVEMNRIAQDNQMSYSYQTDEEFIRCIKYFLEHMALKGFDILEQISEPTINDRPTISQQEYLYQNHGDLAEAFMIEHNISLDCDEVQFLEVIFKAVARLKNEAYQSASDNLIKLSAFYGEWLIKQRTGKWCYEEDMGVDVEFLNQGGYPITSPVLDRIFLCWQRVKEFNESQYKELQPRILLLKS